MCIICNMMGPEPNGNAMEAGLKFLREFNYAQEHMRAATEAMRRCKPFVSDEETRKRYDRTHKAMVRISREWNRIEHEREVKGETE